jgi:hypothetical protein
MRNYSLMLYNQPRTTMFRGNKTPVAEVARELGLPYSLVISRCVMGRETGDDLETDPSPRKPYGELIEIGGVSRTRAEWCKLNGLNQSAVSKRIVNLGWSVERALTTPVRAKKLSAASLDAALSSCLDAASDDS